MELFCFFIPVALWLFVLIGFPHIELLRISFIDSGTQGFTLNNYLAFFLEPIYWRTFMRTAVYSTCVTCLVLVLSLPVVFYITKVANIKAQAESQKNLPLKS